MTPRPQFSLLPWSKTATSRDSLRGRLTPDPFQLDLGPLSRPAWALLHSCLTAPEVPSASSFQLPDTSLPEQLPEDQQQAPTTGEGERPPVDSALQLGQGSHRLPGSPEAAARQRGAAVQGCGFPRHHWVPGGEMGPRGIWSLARPWVDPPRQGPVPSMGQPCAKLQGNISGGR